MQISFGVDDCFPVWSRNARQILYQDAGGFVQVIDYTTKGDAFVAGKPRPWLAKHVIGQNRRRFFDLAPDGKRIVTFARPPNEADSSTLRIAFMFNFFDELRRRLPDGR